MAYCIYLRKSRADIEAEAAGEGETLTRHEKALSALAARQQLAVTAIYREILSGESITARPVMQQLLCEVEQGVWQGVLVMEVERLARGDTIDQGIVARAFQYSGTKIITPLKTFDPRNEYDEEYFEFGLFMSRREYKNINRRLQRGRMASLREGKWLGSLPPYGYERSKLKHEKGFTLRPVPEEAEIVRLIYEYFTEGRLCPDGSRNPLSCSEIACYLNGIHINTHSGQPWRASGISEILHNPVYIGKLRWGNRRREKRVEKGEVIVSRPRGDSENMTLFEGLHPPLVPVEQFEAASRRLKKRTSPSSGGRTLRNPLAGVLFCAECGAGLVRQPCGKSCYLICPTKNCPTVGSPLPLVESAIISALSKYLSPLRIEPLSPTKHPATAEAKMLAQKEKERHRLLLQHERACELLEQGIYTPEIYQERRRTLERKLEQLSIDIASLSPKPTTVEASPEFPANFASLYARAKNAGEKNRLLRSLLHRAVYQKQENGRWSGSTDGFLIAIYPRL